MPANRRAEKRTCFPGKYSAFYEVLLLKLTVSDPPAQSEVQSVVNAYNDLENALRRQGGDETGGRMRAAQCRAVCLALFNLDEALTRQ